MFDKLRYEIIEAYTKANNIKLRKGKFDLEELTHDVNGLLFNCLKSYYFEDLFKNVEFVKTEDKKNNYYFLINTPSLYSRESDIQHVIKDPNDFTLIENHFKNENKGMFQSLRIKSMIENKKIHLTYNEVLTIFGKLDINEYPIVIDAFSDEYSHNEDRTKGFPYDGPYRKDRVIASVEMNEKMQNALEFLKQDSVFNMLLETDPVKQLLTVKTKKNIEFKEIHVLNEDDGEIGNHLKFEADYAFRTALRKVYNLRYFTQNRDKDYKAIIAYNDYEIAGITSLVDASLYNGFEKELVIDLSYIEVSEPYYGQKIGMKLVEEAIKVAERSDSILFITSYSPNGSRFLKDKIAEIARHSKISIVPENERDVISFYLEKNKTRPKSEINKKVADILKYIRTNYAENELSHDKVLKDVKDKFMTESPSINKKHKI